MVNPTYLFTNHSLIKPHRLTVSATQRMKELRRTRQIFIPDLILRLHNLLVTHSTMFPGLIQTALDLTKVVAQEDNHVYEEFFDTASSNGENVGAGKLGVYLDRVREVAMIALKSSGTAFQLTMK